MNKIKTFAQNNAAKIAGVGAAFGTLVLGVAAHADTAADIGNIADAVGTTFQTNAVTMLTAVLPYVVTISVVFLAAKLALRWIKKSAH